MSTKNITATALNTLEENLKDEVSQKNILSAIDQLPVLPYGLFECHLGKEMGKIDLAVRLDVQDHKKELAQIKDHLFKLNQHTTHFDIVSDPEQAFSEKNIENLWLEFDTSKKDFSLVPNVFFDMYNIHYQYINHPEKPIEMWSNWFETALKPFKTPHLKHQNILAMTKCIQELPPHSYVHYLGVMKGRSGEIKLCVKLTNNREVLGYLDRINLQYNTETKSKIESLLESSDYTVLNLDILDGKVADEFGIEFYISKNEPAAKHWEKFLTQLTDFGLCTDNQMKSLLKWHKDEISNSSNGLHKPYLHKLNHIKVVCGKNGHLQAKAYLYYAYELN